MASRTIFSLSDNADMSGISSSAGGTVVSGQVAITFNDSDTPMAIAAAITRLGEKLAEEGWV